MAEPIHFHTQTALARAMQQLFGQLEQQLALAQPINVYLAGGMAVHLYTAGRVTTDVDAEFGARVFLPPDLMVDTTLEDGSRQVVYLDTNYNSAFALMHEDYLADSIPLDIGSKMLRVRVLSPVDLAVSKIARLSAADKEDITELVRQGLTTATEIEQRASEALSSYVGGQAMLRLNLSDALDLASQAEASRRLPAYRKGP